MEWIVLNILTGLGLTMAWHRAAPLRGLRESVILHSSRIHRWMAPKDSSWFWKILGYPFWISSSGLGCYECSSFWFGCIAGLMLGSGTLNVSPWIWWLLAGLMTFVAGVFTSNSLREPSYDEIDP